jgi:uncharacterized membrane protein
MLSDEETNDEGIPLSSRLFTFLILGIALVFVGIAVLVVASVVLGGSGSVGGVILIGPIPIVFGAGPDAAWLIAISTILAVASIILFYVMNRRVKRNYDD